MEKKHAHNHTHGHNHAHGSGEGHAHCQKIILSSVLLAVAVTVEHLTQMKTFNLLLMYLVPFLIVGWETLREAVESLLRGKPLDEAFLMTVATVGAMAVGFFPDAEPQFPEAVFVMLFYQIGELFEGIAAGRSRKAIADLMDIRPDTANVERKGVLEIVNPSEVKRGEIIVIRPGEKIPMDGIVIEGASSLDTIALTGESVPRGVSVEDDVISGCVNISGLLRVRVTKSFSESTASKIIDLVENASEGKSKRENFITCFAKIYTPVVVALAVSLALVPPMFGLGAFSIWIYRALTFLIVSCPCALVISVPLSFFGGIGAASKRGILVKGSAPLEALSRIGTVVFDKTGTLTKGVFEVTAVHPEKIDERELLHIAAHVERFSNHPIAVSLRSAYPDESDGCGVSDVEEIPGQGVRAVVNGHTVCAGNMKMMSAVGAEAHGCHLSGTVVHIAIDGEYAGHIVISDRIKEDSEAAVSALRKAGVNKTVMLTGDNEEAGRVVAEAVGIDEYHAGLLPADKVSEVERLLAEKPVNKVLAFVGDGINDAPVLARADVGIAMGGLGSDAAMEAADVVLMDDRPSKISEAVRIARRTIRIAKENICFALSVKLSVLVLAAFGLTTLWMAVFADVGVTVLAVMNAMRTMKASHQ